MFSEFWHTRIGVFEIFILNRVFYTLIFTPYVTHILYSSLNSLHTRILCAKFGLNWPSGSGEEVENVKSLQTDRQTYRHTDIQTDWWTERHKMVDRQSEKLTWAFNSGELIKGLKGHNGIKRRKYRFHETVVMETRVQ